MSVDKTAVGLLHFNCIIKNLNKGYKYEKSVF